MITRIELKHFMSHVHTVIEPAPGLTVLVGPNNCGKSAVVAALQILCHNDNSTYVLRHGEKECSVKVTTSDGHSIEWRRKNSPSYVIDGQLFDRLRGVGLPEELHRALRLPYVDGGSDGQFDVHFGEQKSPIFLLDQSSATAAKFFSSSSDAGRLLQMQRRHKEKHVQRQREKNRLEAESRQLNAELEALLPAIDLDELLQAVERLHDALAQEAVWLAQAERDQAALVALHQTVARHAALSQSLAPLAVPPDLTSTELLEDLAAKMEQAEADQSRSDARLAALARLPMPPSLEDEVGLAATIDGLHKWDTAADREQEKQQSLLALKQPPALADTADLLRLVDRLTAAVRNLDEAAARQQALAEIAPPPGMSDERSLADLVERFALADQNREHWQEVAIASAIGPPAIPQDWQPLENCVVQLARAVDQSSHLTTDLTTAAAALMAAETALREFAASEVCPTCGSQLDADRLITGAALSGASFPGGGGGHDHG